MKTLALALLCLCVVARAEAPAKDPWRDRHLVATSKLASVYVERTLYRSPKYPNGFVVAVWIRNLSSLPIGLEGDGERWFIHPNQWLTQDTPKRTVVDERTMIPQKLDGEREAELRRRLREKTMTILAPNSSLQTFVPFDGPAGPSIEKAKGRYVIVTFDGQLLVTDGKLSESLSAKAGDLTASDLGLPTPLHWEQAPPTPQK